MTDEHIDNEESRHLDADSRIDLMRSLLERRAIPECRLKYFTDPRYNIRGRGRSRRETFESNGTRGNEIFTHGHFTKYPRYSQLA